MPFFNPKMSGKMSKNQEAKPNKKNKVKGQGLSADKRGQKQSGNGVRQKSRPQQK